MGFEVHTYLVDVQSLRMRTLGICSLSSPNRTLDMHRHFIFSAWAAGAHHFIVSAWIADMSGVRTTWRHLSTLAVRDGARSPADTPNS